MRFFLSADFFFKKSTFGKKTFRNTIRVSKRLDTVQALLFVGPDLGPNCMQKELNCCCCFSVW